MSLREAVQNLVNTTPHLAGASVRDVSTDGWSNKERVRVQLVDKSIDVLSSDGELTDYQVGALKGWGEAIAKTKPLNLNINVNSINL